MIYITDDQKKEIGKLPIEAENCDDWPQNKGRLLALISSHPWGTGLYHMRMKISSPAPKLQGIKHTFMVKYDLCGIEYMVQMVLRAIAVFLGLVGLTIGLYLYSTRKRLSVVRQSEQDAV
ncbi:MAG: hypothetical protein QM703_11890 [Gemmatales bacterium]